MASLRLWQAEDTWQTRAMREPHSLRNTYHCLIDLASIFDQLQLLNLDLNIYLGSDPFRRRQYSLEASTFRSLASQSVIREFQVMHWIIHRLQLGEKRHELKYIKMNLKGIGNTRRKAMKMSFARPKTRRMGSCSPDDYSAESGSDFRRSDCGSVPSSYRFCF